MDQPSDIELLETKLGGVVLKEMTALTFLGWLSGKLNGVTITNDPNLAELRTAIAAPPMAPRMSDDTKLRYVRKLMAIGISI